MTGHGNDLEARPDARCTCIWADGFRIGRKVTCVLHGGVESTEPTAQSTPTPAPVAVPEGDQFRADVRAYLLEKLDTVFPDIPGEDRELLATATANEVLWQAQDHYERPAPRPEPVTAPLPSEAVTAALAAEADYMRERDAARRAVSQCVYGHPGASIPSCAPDPQEAMRRSLAAALPHLLPAADQRARDEGTVRSGRSETSGYDADVIARNLASVMDELENPAYRIRRTPRDDTDQED